MSEEYVIEDDFTLVEPEAEVESRKERKAREREEHYRFFRFMLKEHREVAFLQAVALGILCNALVCLAVWLTYSARSTMDKILAIVFPIAAFVAAGFEHSVANMYFISFGLMIKDM